MLYPQNVLQLQNALEQNVEQGHALMHYLGRSYMRACLATAEDT